jgi:hypothetical protein
MMNIENTNQKLLEEKAGSKLKYSQPNLKFYGDLRTATLAPTPAQTTESGFGKSKRNPKV